LDMVSTRPSGTAMPALLASARATASHTTVLISSSLRGNFAIARCRPSQLQTPSAGRRRATIRRKQQSQILFVSFSSMTCSAAESSLGSSTRGGMRLTPSSRRTVRPRARRSGAHPGAPHRRPKQEVNFLKCARRGGFALRASALHPAHERPSPPVRRGVADRAEHWRVSRRVKRAGANLQGRLQGESRGFSSQALSYSKVALSLFLRT